MKYWIKFLVCLSFPAFAQAQTPVEITNNILSSNQPLISANSIFHNNKVLSKLDDYISEYGAIIGSNCFLNHDSNLFDTVTCQIKHKHLKNGSVWEFYYFLDGANWVGTNLMHVQNLPQTKCLINLELNRGIGLGFNFTESQC